MKGLRLLALLLGYDGRMATSPAETWQHHWCASGSGVRWWTPCRCPYRRVGE